MITITAKALEKVKEFARASDLHNHGLRVSVVGGGCAGFSYSLAFDEPSPIDETFEYDGVSLCIDPLSFQYLDGSEIDFVEKTEGAGFTFRNPNVKSTCGCGSSFSA